LADLDATWGDGIFTSDRWIEIIYSGVWMLIKFVFFYFSVSMKMSVWKNTTDVRL
jgi:hypothetical protein